MLGRSAARLGVVLLATVSLGALGCGSAGNGEKPGGPPKPDSVVATPAMLDLSLVPVRPALIIEQPLRVGAVKDPKPDSVTPDTNDAEMYYAAGLAARWWNPAGAAAAFFWASRLNPAWAEPYFARWYVLSRALKPVVDTKGRTHGYFLTDSAHKRLDSLVVLAQLHDPFFDEGLMLADVSSNMHAELAQANARQHRYVREVNQRRVEAGAIPILGVPDVQIQRSWYAAYVQRHFDSAAKELGAVIKHHPDALQLYMYRAKSQYYLRQYDSAAATLTAALGRVDKQDTSRLVPVYFSRDMFAYAIAMAQQKGHRDSAAQATFQRTVTENLGFYMAHLHLGSVALTVRDTVTALNEIRLATEIQPRDPVVQLFLGYALLNAHHTDEAIEHLRAAVTEDPEYALPYFYLAQAYETKHDSTHARGSYGDFLSRASRKDNLRETATLAISTLGGSPGH